MPTNGTDPNLVTGWTVQAHAPNPYSQPPNPESAAATIPSQAGAGKPSPIPGDVTDILANPGYAQPGIAD